MARKSLDEEIDNEKSHLSNNPYRYWYITTELPHAEFNITENDEYGASNGIVFNLDDLPELPEV